jgi:hypothetical protein
VGGKMKDGLMSLYLAEISISIIEKVWEIVEENSFPKREFLFEEFSDLLELEKLYKRHEEEGVGEFSWKLCIDKGWLSFQNLGHFKDVIIESGVTEEEWKKYLWEHWNDWEKEKVENLLKGYDGYRIDHFRKAKKA